MFSNYNRPISLVPKNSIMHLITFTRGLLEAKHQLINPDFHTENRETGHGVFTKENKIFVTLIQFVQIKYCINIYPQHFS